MCERWIRNRSFKQLSLIEAGCVGYVADFVSIAGMYSSQHEKYTRSSGLSEKRIRHTLEGPIVMGDIDRWYVCVFEVKVSRADFLNTFGGKKTPHAAARKEPVGTAHWIVADKEVCEASELPDFWGLLTPYGAGLREEKMPTLNVLTDAELHSIAFAMIWDTMNLRTDNWRKYRKIQRLAQQIRTAIIHGDQNRLTLLLLDELESTNKL